MLALLSSLPTKSINIIVIFVFVILNMAGRQYTHALVTRVSQQFCPKNELDEAKLQHETFVKLLRDLGLDVIELAPDETLPLGVYIEDTAVVVNGSALITRPGDTSRQKEVAAVRAVLKKDLQLPIVEMADETAKLDGGDVLFTGREFFVGLSSKTNEAGARAVAAAFPEFPTTPVPVPGSTHLKHFVSVAGPELLCVASTKPAQDLIKRIERDATFSYSTLTVPEETAANVLYVNGTLIHRTEDEIPASYPVFVEKVDFARRQVKVGQLIKPDYNLSSCCLLLRRSKHIRNL